MTAANYSVRGLGLASAVFVLAACGHVIETQPMDQFGSPSAPACVSALGNYYLPKALLNLTATSTPSPLAIAVTLSADVTTVAERDQAFCLDYLSSSTSKDAVGVNRTESGLLLSVNANVEDRSPTIITNLIQSAANFAIARDAVVGGRPDKVDLQFDPFSARDMLLVKIALRRFGLCLYVEGYSFPTGGLSASQIRAAGSTWCATDARQTVPYEHPLYKFANLPVAPEMMQQGILYRPKTTHKVVIMKKDDPGGSDSWNLYQTKLFELPNATPVLAIGVDRAMFAKRITSLSFSNGTLTDVIIDKDSEAVGFVSIPLVAAQAIVDIPGQMLRLRIADTQSHAALIQAQGNLLTAISNYNTAISPAAGAGALPKSASVRDGQFIGACINAGADAATCRDLQRTGR
jgi:hypothetical protein